MGVLFLYHQLIAVIMVSTIRIGIQSCFMSTAAQFEDNKLLAYPSISEKIAAELCGGTRRLVIGTFLNSV